jgi:hypothetical protein
VRGGGAGIAAVVQVVALIAVGLVPKGAGGGGSVVTTAATRLL